MTFSPLQIALVALGGGLGSALRYVVGVAAERAWPVAALPVGTLAVNVAGSLAIGLLGGWAGSRALLNPDLRLFLVTGLLGGFTTFSAFAWETLGLGLQGEGGRLALNVAAQLLLGLGAAAAGYAAGRAL